MSVSRFPPRPAGPSRRPLVIALLAALAAVLLSTAPSPGAQPAGADPDSAPPRLTLTGVMDRPVAPVRLELAGTGDSVLVFGPPISCRLGLSYLRYTPEDGHAYTVVPLRGGAAGMAAFCDQRLYKRITVRRAGPPPPATAASGSPPDAPASAYEFLDAVSSPVPVPVRTVDTP